MSVQQEIIMLPRVVTTTHNGQTFAFNGASGLLQNGTGLVVFQYADEFDIDRIWATANGDFVCEE